MKQVVDISSKANSTFESAGAKRDAGLPSRGFARAAHHSRTVRRLRWALPVMALLAVAAIAISVATPNILLPGVKYNGASLTRDGLTIDAPKMAGTDVGGRHYEVTSDKAVQDVDGSGLIHLFGIHGQISEPTGVITQLSSDKGLYDPKHQQLKLDQNIKVSNSDGQTLFLTHADVDLASGAIQSNEPMTMTSAQWQIRADSVSMDQKQQIVRFIGQVRITVQPKSSPKDAADGQSH